MLISTVCKQVSFKLCSLDFCSHVKFYVFYTKSKGNNSLTLSALTRRCSHSVHFWSSSSFFLTQSSYLACSVAIPSCTSCSLILAASRIAWVSARSAWAWASLSRLGATPLATKWYLCMARVHRQMEVQALETCTQNKQNYRLYKSLELSIQKTVLMFIFVLWSFFLQTNYEYSWKKKTVTIVLVIN